MNFGDGGNEIIPTASMSDYMISAHEANKLVYCRFGEKYM